MSTLEQCPTTEASALRQRVLSARDEILAAATLRGVTNVRLFGSVPRGDDRRDSDVDLLVDPAATTGLLELIGLQHDVEDLLGAPVDIVPADGLKSYLRPEVLQGAPPLHVMRRADTMADAITSAVAQLNASGYHAVGLDGDDRVTLTAIGLRTWPTRESGVWQGDGPPVMLGATRGPAPCHTLTMPTRPPTKRHQSPASEV